MSTRFCVFALKNSTRNFLPNNLQKTLARGLKAMLIVSALIGRIAQRESASLTRKKSLVRSQVRPL